MKVATSLVLVIAICGAVAVAQNSNQEDSVVSVLRPPMDAEVIYQDPVPLPPPPTGEPVVFADAGAGCCQVCCAVRCCCASPTVPVTFCLVDPCGCSHEACVNVPVCCAGEQPVISWRGGLVGRQVATLCWPCCDHKVRVIIKRCGKVKVRD